MFKLYIAILTALCPLALFSEVSSQGNIAFENRIFEDDKNALTVDQNNSIAADLEVNLEKGILSSKVKVFSRTDLRDNNRDVFYLTEAYLKWQGETQSLSLGTHKFNWSSNEAFHPLDSLNSRNFDGNFENAEKLGEPSLLYKYESDNYFVDLGFLPSLTIPLLPAASNRLSFSSVALSKPYWIDSKNQLNTTNWVAHAVPQYFFKWSGNYFNADINISYLDHLSRENVIMAFDGVMSTNHAVFVPVKQMGLGVQKAFSEWIVKLEALNRDFVESSAMSLGSLSVLQDVADHSVVALGLENGFTHSSGGESTFIFEYQKILGVEKAVAQSLNAFQNDILLGWRFAFNNINGSEIFVSVIYDLEKESEYLFNLSYSSRLSDVWKYSAGYRSYESTSTSVPPNGFENFKESDHLFFNLSRYF
ncbi:hypothetical protein N9W41_01565 [bacterium]|nr:hypothetical protein [bacterium]